MFFGELGGPKTGTLVQVHTLSLTVLVARMQLVPASASVDLTRIQGVDLT